nr:hypothetical protein [Vibrio splendidus]MCC4883007.1 hypothetical protein [Vibrio splendidus]
MKNPSKPIDIKLARVDENENILIMLELALKGSLEPVDAIHLINDIHFDQNGSTGHYSLLPNNLDDLSSEFVLSVEALQEDKMQSLYNYSVNKGDEITKVKILLVVEEYSTIDEEMNALALEFDEFVLSGECVEWTQLPMHGARVSPSIQPELVDNKKME